ncbi:cyclophilin-like protein [Rhizodiscina lignyota]|uniref:Cyclophilin-like protein n=1 Tax=Rhizodiscina lignyota TaxID=1504668 RepID=A0A9P4M6M5_9PEZI|nr:cyclophilin-like protein [Rhizodiscina lignyota]
MSGFQALEPQPTAEVVLYTTVGEIRLELFAKQTPLASRNFLQLCLDGYYDNTIFHRLVPGFIIQGGDPTGTGTGGESSLENGAPFADEFHSRLKFNRRGLLGMANSGKKDDNGSQFFLTLGETPELNGKNTMFGRIEGQTIYNLVKMAEAELVEGTERPQYPTKITGTAVVLNPFDDLVKRSIALAQEASVKLGKKKPKRRAGRAFLSFADEEEEEEEVPYAKKRKVSQKAITEAKKEHAPWVPPPKEPSPDEPLPDEPPAKSRPTEWKDTDKYPIQEKSSSPSPSEPSDQEQVLTSKAAIRQTNEEIAKLKASMKRKGPNAATTSGKPKTVAEVNLDHFIPPTATKGRKRHAGRQSGPENLRRESRLDKGLQDLQKFQAKLDAAQAASRAPNDAKRSEKFHDGADSKAMDDDEEAALCDLHFIANCQSCTKWDKQDNGVDEDDTDKGWMSHKLTFAKDRLGKDLEWKRKNEEELVVIDPLEKSERLKQRDRQEKEKTRYRKMKDTRR